MGKIGSFSELQALNEKSQQKKDIKILVGMATCGIAAGAKEALEAMKDEAKKHNLDKVTFVNTGCLGACYAEPTVEVQIPGQEPMAYAYVNEKKARDIISKHLVKQEPVSGVLEPKEQVRIALRNCGLIDPENIHDYISNEGYYALGKVLMEMTPGEVINEIKRSGLRGRGGGGFPTGIKWEAASKNKSDIKYIICNADEGDPGAFMDRSILEGDPHSVLEAMAIAGYAIGAKTGYIYIRAEYPLAITRLEIALQQARELGLLGHHIMGTSFSFDIFLRYGAGAFVCGEETSLINSIQGKRGEPTNKPPFPSEKGLWNRPTIVNNVETLANVATIILKGSEWFAGLGTEKSKGTKVFALAGSINKVGLIEVPMGTTLREIIYDIGGGISNNKKFKAVQTGGPSGGCLTEKHLDTPIDYESLKDLGTIMGSGGMIVMNEEDCMVNFAKFYLEFSCEESCGKCTPCRVGNKRLLETVTKITTGKGTPDDLKKIKELANYIKDTALCGLGQTSPNPVLSTLEYFYEEYRAHVEDKKCPAHVCPDLTKYSILADRCQGCGACIRVCPSGCITGIVKEPHEIDGKKCIKCGSCFTACKFNAIYRR